MKGERLYKKALQLATEENANLDEVVNLLQKSCNLGYPDALYAIGNWHIHGKYFKRDYHIAVSYLLKAVKKNHAGAQFDLALCYENGTGVKKDMNKALKYYVQAMLNGDYDSIFEVGRIIYHYHNAIHMKQLGKVFTDYRGSKEQDK